MRKSHAPMRTRGNAMYLHATSAWSTNKADAFNSTHIRLKALVHCSAPACVEDINASYKREESSLPEPKQIHFEQDSLRLCIL